MKCIHCNIESPQEKAFIQRGPFVYCPICDIKTKNQDLILWFGFQLFLLSIGILFIQLDPGFILGPFLVNFEIAYFSMILLIIPHELGHAFSGKLLGGWVNGVTHSFHN